MQTSRKISRRKGKSRKQRVFISVSRPVTESDLFLLVYFVCVLQQLFHLFFEGLSLCDTVVITCMQKMFTA